MKFIVLTDGNKESMFLMPRDAEFTHKKFAEAVQGYRHGREDRWERSFCAHDVVSAGFVSRAGKVHGESESIGVKCRGEADQKLYDQMFERLVIS